MTAERDPDVPPPGWDDDEDWDEDEDDLDPVDINREGDPAFNGAFDRW